MTLVRKARWDVATEGKEHGVTGRRMGRPKDRGWYEAVWQARGPRWALFVDFDKSANTLASLKMVQAGYRRPMMATMRKIGKIAG